VAKAVNDNFFIAKAMSEQLYNPDYLAETQRLLEELKYSTYTPFLSISGRMVEVGCGTGDDAINIAKATAGNGLEVFGLDASEVMIQEANSRQSKANDKGIPEDQMTNVRFMIGNASHLPFEDGALSGLRAERLVQHLPNPEEVFAEFYRTLVAGSPLVVVETDWNSISFYNGDPRITQRLRNYLTERNVKNGNAAATLIHDLQAAGFSDVAVRLWPLASRSLEQCVQLLRFDVVLTAMQDAGELTADEAQTLMNALRVADDRGQFICSINLIVVSAKR